MRIKITAGGIHAALLAAQAENRAARHDIDVADAENLPRFISAGTLKIERQRAGSVQLARQPRGSATLSMCSVPPSRMYRS